MSIANRTPTTAIPDGRFARAQVNFAEFVLQYGDDFIPFLIEHIDPNEKILCFSL